MSLTCSALIMSHRTVLTCSCALLSQSRCVMEPLKTIPEFHPIPFKQGKYLSIKTRTLAKYNETRSGISGRIASLETILNKLKREAACLVGNNENEITERESVQLPPLLHLPLPLAEEVTHLYSKVNSVEGENGFVIDDALIYKFFHSLIAAGDYRTALTSVLHDKILAEARGPPLPLSILEDLNYVLRSYVIPQLPCSSAHFTRITSLIVDTCNETSTNILYDNAHSSNKIAAGHSNIDENSTCQDNMNFDKRRERQRVIELAVEDEITLYRNKEMPQHAKNKLESSRVKAANEVNHANEEEFDEIRREAKCSWRESPLFSTELSFSSYKQSAHCHYIIEEFVLPIWQAALQMGLLCLPIANQVTNSKEQKSIKIYCNNEYPFETEDDNSKHCCTQQNETEAKERKHSEIEDFQELLLSREVVQSLIDQIVHCFDAHDRYRLVDSIANDALCNLQNQTTQGSATQHQSSKDQESQKEEQQQQNKQQREVQREQEEREVEKESNNYETNKLQILESLLQFYLNLACIASEVQDEHWLMQMLTLFCNIFLQKAEINSEKDECKGVLQRNFALELNVQDWSDALFNLECVYNTKHANKDDENTVNESKTEFMERASELLRCFASEYLAVIYYGLHSIQRERQLLYAVELKEWESIITKNKESLISSVMESLSAFHTSEAKMEARNVEETSGNKIVNNYNDEDYDSNAIINVDYCKNNNLNNENIDTEEHSNEYLMHDTNKNNEQDNYIRARATEILHKAICKVMKKVEMTYCGSHSCSNIDVEKNKFIVKRHVGRIHALVKQFLICTFMEQYTKNKSNAKEENDENAFDNDDHVITFAEPILNYILVTNDVEWLTTLSENDHWRSSIKQILSSSEEEQLYNTLVQTNAQTVNTLVYQEQEWCYEKKQESSQKIDVNKIGIRSKASYIDWFALSEKLLQSTAFVVKEENKATTKLDKNDFSHNSISKESSCTLLFEEKSVVFERLQRITDGLVELFTSTHINKCVLELLSKIASNDIKFAHSSDNNNSISSDMDYHSNYSNPCEKEITNINCYAKQHLQRNNSISKHAFTANRNTTAEIVSSCNNKSFGTVLSHFVSTLMREASLVSSSEAALALTPYSITSLAFLVHCTELTSNHNECIANTTNNNTNESTDRFLSQLASIVTNQLECCRMCRAELYQNNSSYGNTEERERTNKRTCDTIRIDNLEMLYSGNALSLFLIMLAQRHMWDDVLSVLRAMCGSGVLRNVISGKEDVSDRASNDSSAAITTTTASPESSSLPTQGKVQRSMSFITCQSMEPIILHALFRLARSDGACMVCAELRQHRHDIFF